MVQGAGWPIDIGPHVGRLSNQVKHRQARQHIEPSRAPSTSTPGSQEERPGAPSNLYESTFSVFGPHWTSNFTLIINKSNHS
jgi:hypothetical protein